MSLDSRWLLRVKDTTSKNPDKWVTLKTLDNYINTDENERIRLAEEAIFPADDPDGTSLQERMDALDDTETGAVPALTARADIVDQQLFETQGMADKLAAMELRKDEVVEILENKNIVNPQINETPVRAYFDIALNAPATRAIRISAITPGVAANSYTYAVMATADPEDVAILWSAPDLVLRVLKDDDKRIVTTAYELARLAAVTPDFTSNFIISFDNGTLIAEDGDGAGVIRAADSGSFANGAGSDHVMTSTGTQIDAVVAQYHKNKYDGTTAPGATDDSTDGYSVGSKWFDAVATEWYICTSAVENTATWELTTLDTGDLGSAAVADIVNDLTTGGTTDALSAEQGKELKSTLNTEAGYIDALQAVAPEYTATFGTATAATATYTTDETNPAVGSTVVVNDQTYRFMDTTKQANDVKIGDDADTSLGNLVAAINLSGTPGIEYHAGTAAATGVSAATVDKHATVVTADTKGTAANAYRKWASTDPDSHIDVDVTDPADKFSGGVDGQVGATGKIVFTASAVYCCTDGTKCVITDSDGWKSAALS